MRFWKPTLRKTRPYSRLSQFAQFFLIYFLTFFHWVVITLRQDEGWVQKAMIKEDKTRGSCTNHVDIWGGRGFSKNHISTYIIYTYNSSFVSEQIPIFWEGFLNKFLWWNFENMDRMKHCILKMFMKILPRKFSLCSWNFVYNLGDLFFFPFYQIL